MPLPEPRTTHRRSSRVLVVKFGGTSVARASRVRRAARRIAALRDAGWTPVVVVSAAGHTTDRLLADLAGVAGSAGHAGAALVALEPGAIASSLAAGVVPVVAGFQGLRADGEIVTLGRGSSDTSAVFLACALGARECHIVTDVRGVYDADPRLVPDARFLPELGAGELVALCEAGAQVVHPEAARRARDGDVALRIHHHLAPIGRRAGTRVVAEAVA